MHKAGYLLLLALLAQQTFAKVYFKETFDEGWRGRWVDSTSKSDYGKVDVDFGEINGGTDAEKGLKMTEDMRNYAVSAKFDGESNVNKDIVIQYQTKLPKKFDCGGAYLKLFPAGFEQDKLNGETDYNVMFGPDHCGYSTKKIHAILNYKGKNVDKKDEVKIEYNEKDELTHLYTFILKGDKTYEIQFDGKTKASGNIKEDWPFLAPKEIDDPEDRKPSDWVDEVKIDDPEDKKPEGYDDIPKQITDPAATKPDDWDDESDGEWEAPMIDNSEYKGEWKAKKIDNPEYKGEWKPKRIANPDYKDDDSIGEYSSFGGVAVEIWNVNAGVVFDNIIVTDSLEEAKEFADSTFKGLVDAEKAAKEAAEKAEKEKKEAEKEKKEAEEKSKKAAEEEDDDDSDDGEEEKKKDEL